MSSVRETAGWWDESDRARIRVTGKDRVKFLQNMTSQDVKALAPGEAAWACALTIKAKLVAAFRVATGPDFFILDVERERAAALVEHLKKFVVVNQVVFADETDATGAIAIEGPHVDQRFAWTASLQSVLAARGASISGERCVRIYGPRAAIATLLTRIAEPPVPPAAVEVLRIENGTPRFGADLDEDTLPPETPLDRTALSYTKGCFLGQEPIARLHFRGHVNKSLQGLVFGQAPATGKLQTADGKDVGRVTSFVAESALGRPIGLGYVRREASEPGTKLTVEGGGTVEVRALPLVKPTDPEPVRAPPTGAGPGPALKPGSSGPAAIMPGGAPK